VRSATTLSVDLDISKKIFKYRIENIDDVLHGVSANRFDVGSGHEDASFVTTDASVAIDRQGTRSSGLVVRCGLLTNRARGASSAANLPSRIS
jgi:hypothetical protein